MHIPNDVGLTPSTMLSESESEISEEADREEVEVFKLGDLRDYILNKPGSKKGFLQSQH